MKNIKHFLLVTLLWLSYYTSGLVIALLGSNRADRFWIWCNNQKLVKRDSLVFFSLVIVSSIFFIFDTGIGLIILSVLCLANIIGFVVGMIKTRRR